MQNLPKIITFGLRHSFDGRKVQMSCFNRLKSCLQISHHGHRIRGSAKLPMSIAHVQCERGMCGSRPTGGTVNGERKQNLNQFNRQKLSVHPFGCLKLTSPFNIKITSANAQEYPEMDQLICYSEAPGLVAKIDKRGTDILAHVDEKFVAEDLSRTDAAVAFEVPIKFGLDISAQENADINVSRVESDALKITSDGGLCQLISVKCGSLDMTKKEGVVRSSNLLQGNIHLNLLKGDITMDKVQGQSVKIINQNGDVTIQSLYAETSNFSIVEGNLGVKNCHGNSRITIEQGNLTIDSLDGDVIARVSGGNINVHVMRHQNIELEARTGKISLTLDTDIASSFEISAEEISISENVGMQKEKTTNDGQLTGFVHKSSEKMIKLKAPVVDISTQDWLSALKFR